MSAGADASELRALSVSLGDVGDVVGKKIYQATEHSARSIKDEWNAGLRDESHGPYWQKIGAGAVDYDMEQNGRLSSFAASGHVSSISAEIGPNLVRGEHLGAAFAGWYEEGSVNRPNKSFGSKALKNWEADWREHVADAAAEAIEEA